MSDKIEILDLLALASFKTLQNFDTSSIHYHLNDEDGLVEEVSQAFQKQFKENFKECYSTQKRLIGAAMALDQLHYQQSED